MSFLWEQPNVGRKEDRTTAGAPTIIACLITSCFLIFSPSYPFFTSFHLRLLLFACWLSLSGRPFQLLRASSVLLPPSSSLPLSPLSLLGPAAPFHRNPVCSPNDDHDDVGQQPLNPLVVTSGLLLPLAVVEINQSKRQITTVTTDKTQNADDNNTDPGHDDHANVTTVVTAT